MCCLLDLFLHTIIILACQSNRGTTTMVFLQEWFCNHQLHAYLCLPWRSFGASQKPNLCPQELTYNYIKVNIYSRSVGQVSRFTSLCFPVLSQKISFYLRFSTVNCQTFQVCFSSKFKQKWFYQYKPNSEKTSYGLLKKTERISETTIFLKINYKYSEIYICHKLQFITV